MAGLDIGTRKFVLGHVQLLELNIGRQVHALGVNFKDAPLRVGKKSEKTQN